MKRWQKILLVALLALIVLFVGFLGVFLPLRNSYIKSQAKSNVEGDTEVINGVTFTHHFADVDGVTWHYVDAGVPSADTVVFIHGLPESWYSWHHQMEELSDNYHLIAIDLKGYGQTDKPEADYKVRSVAEEIVLLFDKIGLQKFNLVSHDWGTAISDVIVGEHSDRVLRYVRMQAPVMTQDSDDRKQFKLLKNQILAKWLMGNSELVVKFIYRRMTVQKIPDDELRRIIVEFSRDGTADTIPKYFRDVDIEAAFSGEMLEQREDMFGAMNLPVLLLQADSDPNQPRYYFENAIDYFPNAKLQWVKNSGHFAHLEQPEVVSKAIQNFLNDLESSQ